MEGHDEHGVKQMLSMRNGGSLQQLRGRWGLDSLTEMSVPALASLGI